EVEAFRHDADHGERLAVDADVPADRVRVAAELRLPQRVAEDDLLALTDLAVLLGERAADRRRHAEQPEERRGDHVDADARRRAVLIDALVAAVVQRL